MLDSNIEDISCDGIDVPVFMYHNKYRNIKTNISFSEEELNSLVIKLCQKSGKHISIGEPMVDATLPDGSRLQATLGKEITTRGSSFTIRKFRGDPITPIDLVNYNTCNIEMMAYFWLAMENGDCAIFAGGTASGKTSLLNAVSLFVPPLSKVVSIEDTRELMLHHDNWIAGVTRKPLNVNSLGEISMYDLLRSALRQRPEYILVGEIRGEEALTLFQAISTGHATYSTMHAGDVQTVVNRLDSPPLNVPHVMLQSLDILSIQVQTFVNNKRVRRTQSLVEFTGIDSKTGYIRINELYRWDPISDTFVKTGDSYTLNKVMVSRGWDRKKLAEELDNRARILTYLCEKNMRDYVRISLVVQAYDANPDGVIDAIEADNLQTMIEQNM
jgi:flagellar protein FlaI